MSRIFGLAVAMVLSLATLAAAVPTITAPDLTLTANTAGQVLTLTVTGGDQVQGADLNFQETNLANGPLVTAANLITGTMFSVSNTGQQSPGAALPGRTF